MDPGILTLEEPESKYMNRSHFGVCSLLAIFLFFLSTWRLSFLRGEAGVAKAVLMASAISCSENIPFLPRLS